VANPFENDDIDYRVVVNDEGQHSLWPVFREIPAGWSPVGVTARRAECLNWIETYWTDITPRSVAAASSGGSSNPAAD
jgi:uncharacterized protein YbdZ (MbtH family)